MSIQAPFGASFPIIATRASFLPGQLTVQASKEDTPFIIFENGTRFIVQANGNLVVYNKGNLLLWNAKSQVGNGDAGMLRLCFQSDGNLVLYHDETATWATMTDGSGKKLGVSDQTPFFMILDEHGNLAWNSRQGVEGGF